jgi:hypothetical protein
MIKNVDMKNQLEVTVHSTTAEIQSYANTKGFSDRGKCFANSASMLFANQADRYVLGIAIGPDNIRRPHSWNKKVGIYFDVTPQIIDKSSIKYVAIISFTQTEYIIEMHELLGQEEFSKAVSSDGTMETKLASFENRVGAG